MISFIPRPMFTDSKKKKKKRERQHWQNEIKVILVFSELYATLTLGFFLKNFFKLD